MTAMLLCLARQRMKRAMVCSSRFRLESRPAVPGQLQNFKPTPYQRSAVVDVRRQMSYD